MWAHEVCAVLEKFFSRLLGDFLFWRISYWWHHRVGDHPRSIVKLAVEHCCWRICIYRCLSSVIHNTRSVWLQFVFWAEADYLALSWYALLQFLVVQFCITLGLGNQGPGPLLENIGHVKLVTRGCAHVTARCTWMSTATTLVSGEEMLFCYFLDNRTLEKRFWFLRFTKVVWAIWLNARQNFLDRSDLWQLNNSFLRMNHLFIR